MSETCQGCGRRVVMEPVCPVCGGRLRELRLANRVEMAEESIAGVKHCHDVNGDMDRAEEVILAMGHDGMTLAEVVTNMVEELRRLRAFSARISAESARLAMRQSGEPVQ